MRPPQYYIIKKRLLVSNEIFHGLFFCFTCLIYVVPKPISEIAGDENPKTILDINYKGATGSQFTRLMRDQAIFVVCVTIVSVAILTHDEVCHKFNRDQIPSQADCDELGGDQNATQLKSLTELLLRPDDNTDPLGSEDEVVFDAQEIINSAV